jgi:hypothetical protein
VYNAKMGVQTAGRKTQSAIPAANLFPCHSRLFRSDIILDVTGGKAFATGRNKKIDEAQI